MASSAWVVSGRTFSMAGVSPISRSIVHCPPPAMTIELGRLVQRIAHRAGAFSVGAHEVDRRNVSERASARLTNLLDSETRAFEAELLQRILGLPVFQRHAWLEHVRG